MSKYLFLWLIFLVSYGSLVQAQSSKKKLIEREPFKEFFKDLKMDQIKSMKMTVLSLVDSETQTFEKYPIDLKPFQEKIFAGLKNARLVHRGQFGVGTWPKGTLKLLKSDKKSVSIELYEFGFFYRFQGPKDKESTLYYYQTPLIYFWSAIRYDKENRIFTEKAYRDLLYQYSNAKKPNLIAYISLLEMQDPRCIELMPDLLEKSPSVVMDILNFVEKVDDISAIKAVSKQLYSSDINNGRFAAFVLMQWGQKTEIWNQVRAIKKSDRSDPEGSVKNLCENVVTAFTEEGKYLEAIKVVKTLGLQKYGLEVRYILQRPICKALKRSKKEKVSPTKYIPKKILFELFLFQADCVELDKVDYTQERLRELWQALNLHYDPEKEALVPFKRTDFTNYQRNADTKKIAGALRAWAKKNFGEKSD